MHLEAASCGEITRPVDPGWDAVRIEIIGFSLKHLPGFVDVVGVAGRGGVHQVQPHTLGVVLLQVLEVNTMMALKVKVMMC